MSGFDVCAYHLIKRAIDQVGGKLGACSLQAMNDSVPFARAGAHVGKESY